MTLNKKTIEILNDLVRINNDRVTGYENANKETATKDSDLRDLFSDLASDSRSYAGQLSEYITRSGEEPARGTTGSGKVYRIWMDLKAAITGKDRKAILASCEFGEDAAQRAYEQALSSDAELPA